MSALELMQGWLRRQLSDQQWQWLEGRNAAGPATAEKDLFITLGLIPRKLGKADLDLTADDLAEAGHVQPGWNPQGWSVDGTARVATLLQTIATANDFPARFRQLCRTADVAEAIAFYRGLILYPSPETLESQAAEGVRSNMRVIFEAVAHDNPYPKQYFAEQRWNHMVLKALFVDSRLHPIQGLDERANPELAAMLRDYARERWAAGRAVTPELWRCVGPFASDEAAVADLLRASESADANERAGAALALSVSPSPLAAKRLAALPDLSAQIAEGSLTWDTLSTQLDA
ncbi:MAG: EboA domain-containing protein [Rhodomicrobiaceae bacterium]